MRVAPRTGALLAGTGLFVVPAAPPAHATLVPIPAGVDVLANGTVFDVCGYGRAASTTNSWTLTVTGSRYYDLISADRTTTAEPRDVRDWPINHTISGSDPVFNACLTVPKHGAEAGQFVVTLSYAGLGPDVTLVLVGEGTWAGHFANGTGMGVGQP